MSALTVRLPESLHEGIKELARREGISVNQFIAGACGEKMAVLKTLEFLRHEAQQGRREDFDRYLTAIPDAEPLAGDE